MEIDVAKMFGEVAPPESAGDMRRMIEAFAPILNAELPPVGAFQEAVPIAEGVCADVVVPPGAGPFPVLVYLHGGAWMCGSPATHRKLGYRFAEAGYLVINVDYRLAPEHPFPTPLEDCVAAIRWAARNAERYGGRGTRLAVAGDSAGGNLAAAAAAELHGDPTCPKAALLIYGVYDFGALDGLLDAPAPGVPREAGEKLIELMVQAYLGRDSARHMLTDPRVSPLHAADRLPPSHVVVGAADPLTAHSRALVDRLAAVGVDHELFVDADMPHGYVQMEFLPAARPAIDRMLDFLRKHV